MHTPGTGLFFSFSEKVTEIWPLWLEGGQQKSVEFTKAALFLWTFPFLCLWPKGQDFSEALEPPLVLGTELLPDEMPNEGWQRTTPRL